MQPPFTLRLATPSDAPALAAFAARTFSDTYRELDDPADIADYTAKHFNVPAVSAVLADPACTTLLVHEGDALAGYAVLAFSEPPDGVDGPAPLELSRFYLSGPYIGRGLGRQLMQAVHDHARRLGARMLWLGVYDKNLRAVRFYERAGFRKVGDKAFEFGSQVYLDPLYAAPVREDSPAIVRLVTPSEEFLPGYVAALERGWSPNNERGLAAAQEELALIAADPKAFVESLDDPEARGGPVKMPDGSFVPRLPGYRRWIWDGEFAGSIGFRWQRGTAELPSFCLGHVGYAVVPWKQRRGYATAALLEMLEHARRLQLPYVEITTDPDNLASQKVIQAAGGTLHERFTKPPQYGSKPCLRFRVPLS